MNKEIIAIGIGIVTAAIVWGALLLGDAAAKTGLHSDQMLDGAGFIAAGLLGAFLLGLAGLVYRAFSDR